MAGRLNGSRLATPYSHIAGNQGRTFGRTVARIPRTGHSRGQRAGWSMSPPLAGLECGARATLHRATHAVSATHVGPRHSARVRIRRRRSQAFLTAVLLVGVAFLAGALRFVVELATGAALRLDAAPLAGAAFLVGASFVAGCLRARVDLAGVGVASCLTALAAWAAANAACAVANFPLRLLNAARFSASSASASSRSSSAVRASFLVRLASLASRSARFRASLSEVLTLLRSRPAASYVADAVSKRAWAKSSTPVTRSNFSSCVLTRCLNSSMSSDKMQPSRGRRRSGNVPTGNRFTAGTRCYRRPPRDAGPSDGARRPVCLGVSASTARAKRRIVGVVVGGARSRWLRRRASGRSGSENRPDLDLALPFQVVRHSFAVPGPPARSPVPPQSSGAGAS